MNVDYLYRRGQLRKACAKSGAHFESWLTYARELREFSGRGTRVTFQGVIYFVEHGLHFCDVRLWVKRRGPSFVPPRVAQHCSKPIDHEGPHLPREQLDLIGIWAKAPPPPSAWPPPRLKNCPCILVTADRPRSTAALLAKLNGVTVSTELTPEAAPGIEAVFDAVQVSTPELNTARAGLSPERLERLMAPDPKRNESPMKRKGEK